MDKLVYDHIVIRYGELSTKGKNRKNFEKQLLKNVKQRLHDYKNLEYKMQFDGIFVKLNGEDFTSIKEDLKTVFGYSYFSGAVVSGRSIEEIQQTALQLVKEKNIKTFKVAARRNDKTYPIHSDQLNRLVAAAILHNTDLKVDVHNPDMILYVNVKTDAVYITDEKINGPGGYPVSINGKALVMMSGGIDSPVAAYLTMKRGLRIECIHFASQPYTSKQALEKVKSLVKILSPYQESILIHVIPFTDLQLAIYQNAEEPYAVTLMRRMMYRIADKIAQNKDMSMITNGESVGQVASQTPESMKVIEQVSDSLILRPVCMMDKLEIIALAEKIGTYETSILPYEDCCTIFDPKNPTTKPKLKMCELYESKWDWQSMVDACVANEERIKVSYRDQEVEEELF